MGTGAWSAVLIVLTTTLVLVGSTSQHGFPDDPGIYEKVGVVLAPSPRGWDADAVESPSVAWDAAAGQWVMAYTGYGTVGGVQRASIGLAFSRDGRSWHKTPDPILGASHVDGAPDEAGTTGPVLLRTRGGWILFYIGLTATGYEGGEKSINYATADSPAGPWRRRGVLVTPGGSGWRAQAVWHVSVVRDAGRWFMFFNATGADDLESIGYATARRPKGPWTVSGSPVLTATAGEWDGRFVGDPDVRRQGDHWVMDYYGYDGEHAADGQAVTSAEAFPAGWRKTGVTVAPSESYDAKFAHKPWVVRIGGRWFHYYTAVDDDDNRQIALAVERKAPTAVPSS